MSSGMQLGEQDKWGNFKSGTVMVKGAGCALEISALCCRTAWEAPARSTSTKDFGAARLERRVDMYAPAHTHTHTRIHTHIHTHIHTNTHTRLNTYTYT